jgi:nucleoside phosphorylase
MIRKRKITNVKSAINAGSAISVKKEKYVEDVGEIPVLPDI